MEHIFTTYIRTKIVFKHRLKDLKDYDTVKIYMYELDKLGVNNGPLLYKLKRNGEIWYDGQGNFKVMREGPTDPSLLERTKKRVKVKAQLTLLHEWMRDQLMFVELDVPKGELPVYFKAFMEHRDEHLEPFFSVDSFSGRVHSPIVNLKSRLRKELKFHGGKCVSLDVKQMQPTVLAKILLDSIGGNSFSDSIFKGEDVYVLLQRSAKLPTRADAKKFLFQLIFGKPMNDIGKMFSGNTEWVDWINDYKSRTETNNPHKEEKHTNLAWLLQYSEVQVMTGIWTELKQLEIPFLTIHDDVLCREGDEGEVYDVMDRQLKRHFSSFHITVTR